MVYGLIFAFATSGLALLAYIRLAPDDPARWHVAVGSDAEPLPVPCADQITLVAQGARATCELADPPARVLARLMATASASDRVTLLAGSVAEGRLTWVSRSRLMGYPDYITAEARPTLNGTRLDILSRQRYGRGDHGVNAARLRDWLTALEPAPT
jgi:Protein of unknown function (DUF1499)